jgi:riboflavin kinase
VARIFGKIETGQGVGAGFTRTDWALGVFRDAYGIDPFPGTLNVRADAASVAAWQSAAAQGQLFKAPDPAWCDARCLRAKILHQTHYAAVVIVLPLVEGYPQDQIELVAVMNLREWLEARDGDTVTLDLDFETML